MKRQSVVIGADEAGRAAVGEPRPRKIIGIDEAGRAAVGEPRPRKIIGIDEAGRGAWAGPLVAAAITIVKPRNFPWGEVTDSKLLTPQQREILAVQILAVCRVAYGCVSHRTIDRLGLQAANVLAVDLAVVQLRLTGAKLHCDYIGSFHDLSVFGDSATLYIHGELARPEIAAASIMAKVYRDGLMRRYQRQYPAYGFDRHKGYGTEQHRVALRQHGSSAIHRQSFEPVKLMARLTRHL